MDSYQDTEESSQLPDADTMHTRTLIQRRCRLEYAMAWVNKSCSVCSRFLTLQTPSRLGRCRSTGSVVERKIFFPPSSSEEKYSVRSNDLDTSGSVWFHRKPLKHRFAKNPHKGVSDVERMIRAVHRLLRGSLHLQTGTYVLVAYYKLYASNIRSI